LKKLLLEILKRDHIIYGKCYIVQATYSKNPQTNEYDVIYNWTVDKITYYNNVKDKEHMVPVPIERYKKNEPDKALDEFLRLEEKMK